MTPAPPRRSRSDLTPLAIVGLLALVALGLWLVRSASAAPGETKPSGAARADIVEPEPAAPPQQARTLVIPRLDPAQVGAVPLPDTGPAVFDEAGHRFELTLDVGVQRSIAADLARAGVPFAAVVVLDARTGAVRALVERRDAADPVAAGAGLGFASAPAASVFKVVSAAALLDAGVSPQAVACSHGGRHGIDASNLRESARDQRCESLTEALAHSSNGAFARFATRDLRSGALHDMALRFGFGRPLEGDFAVTVSQFDEGQTPLDRARAAPGFAGSTLAPLHAAVLVATVANGGRRPVPWVVQRDGSRPQLDRPVPATHPALDPAIAADLAAMMEQTVLSGTARAAFAHRPPALRDVKVAGKTGSLSGSDPTTYRHYSWFVGFAPVDHPTVAIAVLAVNGTRWRAKAAPLARDALGVWFAAHPAPATGRGVAVSDPPA